LASPGEAATQVDLGDLAALKAALLERIGQRQRSMRPWVEEGELVSVAGDQATLRYAASHAEHGQYVRERCARVAEVLAEIAGRPMQVVVDIESAPEPAAVVVEAPATPAVVRPSIEEVEAADAANPAARPAIDNSTVLNDPLVKSVLASFTSRLVDVK
jgi:hypothetical protein